MTNDHGGQALSQDSDEGKGALENDRPEQATNTADLDAQLDHRFQDDLNKSNDSDFPEPGQNPEYSMQKQEQNELEKDTQVGSRKDPDGNAEGRLNDQDPGEHQKENQNQKKDDDLAA